MSIFTVSQLSFVLKHHIESKFSFISVQGEVSNFKLHSSGHLYFDIKDAGARLSAVMFKGSQNGLMRLPKDGDQVVLKGDLTLYPPQGKYQIAVKSLQFAGLGDLLIKLQELKIKLLEKGYFVKERKKQLPPFPKKIGVVTSATGAVIRDIIQVLTRRVGGFHLILNPVRVQGLAAAKEIALAIDEFNKYELADVLIVGRGGGSLEDLWAFNEEIVADAIFRSLIPIVSAVGHETDMTIADLVADVRAPTPSAAAEIVSQEKSYQLEFLKRSQHNLNRSLVQTIQKEEARLKGFLRHPYFKSPDLFIAPFYQRLDEARDLIDQKVKETLFHQKFHLKSIHKAILSLKPTTQLTHVKHRLHELEKNLQRFFANKFFLGQKQLAMFHKQLNESMVRILKQKHDQLKKIDSHLDSVNPKKVLKRGYAILFAQKNHSAIVSTQELTAHQKIVALLSDGEATMVVEKTHLTPN